MAQRSVELFGAALGFSVIAWPTLVVIAAIALRFAVPVRLQSDTLGAVIVAAVIVAITALSFTALVVFFDVYQEAETGDEGIPLVLAAPPAAAVAVRLGLG